MQRPSSLLHNLLFAVCAAAPFAAYSEVDPATPMSMAVQAALPNHVHLPWTRSANIYEVNLRQYNKEGTFNAFVTHLPTLKKLGVDILWLMPVHPIGERNRKGGMGSYYSVRDYKAVAPEYGSLDDLRQLVKQAHGLGMHVMIDWVGNHTAWDNPWVGAHPEWFKKNAKGEIYGVTFTNDAGATEEWQDVVGLDFKNKELWKGMIDAMAFWVREADIDGFRCDAAGLVPTPFWNQARAELDQIKPMFMLAEWSEPDLHEQAFDMTYAWDLGTVFKKIGEGKADARDLKAYLQTPSKVYGREAYRMLFTNNHDINSWENTDHKLYGSAFKALAVLSFTLPGMPLIYGGQEAALDKKLEFFEKDPIDWKTRELTGFYANLIALKKNNPALWNGQYGGTTRVLETGSNQVFAFQRQAGANLVTVTVNLSEQPHDVLLPGREGALKLAAWDWHVSSVNQ